MVLLDQLTKLWVNRALAGRPPLIVIENFFDLTYHRNAGGVFGLLAGPATMGRRLFFIAVSSLALLLVLHLMREWGRESAWSLCGLSLIAGGAVGNLIDRIIYGEVIDFIDWHWYTHHWPAFNIADSAITSGTIILIISVFLATRRTSDVGS